MIGVFDSGVGGLSVLRELRTLLPGSDLLYYADRGRAPYGPLPPDLVRTYSEEVSDGLLASGAGMVVMACNTASSAALHHLRRRRPDVRFVGMEPAVKPAVEATRSGVIGVLATAGTSQGELFRNVVDRFATGVRVVSQVCEGWVEAVEAGRTEGEAIERVVRCQIEPVLEQGADTLVLACTHFPFLAHAIARVAGPDVTLVDPAPAVARQAARVAAELGLDRGGGRMRLQASGPLDGLGRLVAHLAGMELEPEPVTSVLE